MSRLTHRSCRLLAVLGLAVAAAGLAAAPGGRHPIVGTWTFRVPDSTCVETYFYRSDGTTLVTSAEEVAETRYEISPKPNAEGFYRMVDTLVKDNGKKDCAGQITEAGQVSTRYVRFDPSGALMLLCADESLRACIGPMVRARGQDT